MDYEARSPATRAATLTFIVGVHATLIVAFAMVSGAQVVITHAQPLLVRLMPAREPRQVEIPPALALPTLRIPDIRLPEPPAIENLYTMRVEDRAAPASMVAAVTAPAPAMTQQAAASISAPRADMAYLNNPPPLYPMVSRRAGEQGRVMLRVRVSAEGGVEAIELQASSGYARLDEAAIAAVRRWRFVPARQGDRTVTAWAVVPVMFQLHA